MRHIRSMFLAVTVAALCACATTEPARDAATTRKARGAQAQLAVERGREAVQFQLAQQRAQERFIEQREGRFVAR